MDYDRSVISRQSRTSRLGMTRRSASGSLDSVAEKRTRIIGGHAMAIRDLNIGTMKEHKLESHGKAFY